MKRVISLLSVCLLCIAAAAQTNFRSISFEEALAAAKQENKLVFIDFYTSWCGPCRKMSNEVFPQAKVGDYFNAKFVSLKLNAEKEGKELAQRFKVSAYPTYIILDAEGKVKADFKGAMEADEFIAKIEQALDPEQSPARITERYLAGERTPMIVNNYALQLMQHRKEDEGMKVVDDYFNSLSDAERLKVENSFLFTRYTINIEDAKGRFMVQHKDEFDLSVRETVADRIAGLYRSAVIGYFSGYRYRENLYKEEEYEALKKEIAQLGLDKNYAYAPMFHLIEARIAQNDEAFLNSCEQEFPNLEENDRNILIMNMTRLIQTNDKALLKKMSVFIRTRLAEMAPSTISLSGRILETIESKMNK